MQVLVLVCMLALVCAQAIVIPPIDIDSQEDTSKFNYDIRLYKGSTAHELSWCGTVPNSRVPGRDDRNCIKKFPSKFTREWNCPSYHSANLGKYYVDIQDAKKNIEPLLEEYIPSSIGKIAALLIKRDANNNFRPMYRYIGNNDYNAPYYAWSCSKEFGMSTAAGRMRIQCGFGMDSHEVNTDVALGDWTTIITTYDDRNNYTSNDQSWYYLDISGRDRTRAVTRQLLNEPSQDCCFSYGAGPHSPTMYPSKLGFTFRKGNEVCVIQPNKNASFDGEAIQTHISAMTMSDWLHRIVMHRDLPQHERIPGMAWEDATHILYGAGNTSTLFKGLQYGGMSIDPSVYTQMAIDVAQAENRAKGQWRIFSKMGSGWSDAHKRYEITYNGYTCLPHINPVTNVPVLDDGLELVYSMTSWDTSILADPADAKMTKMAKILFDVVSKLD